MDAIAMLRAKALTDPPKARYPLCVDREARLQLAALRQKYVRTADKLAREAASRPAVQSLGDSAPVQDDDAILAAIEREIEEAQEAAKGDVIVLVFRRLPTTAESAAEGEHSYLGLEQEHTDATGNVNYRALGTSLLPLCYERAESIHGDLGMTWAEALTILDAGDLEHLRDMIVGHHRIGGAVPFDPVSSGPPATTSKPA